MIELRRAGQVKKPSVGRRDSWKLVADADTVELLGGHIVGEQEAETVCELLFAMKFDATADVQRVQRHQN